MKLKFKRNEFLIFMLLAVIFIFAVYIYPMLPEKVASHWNIKGEVDGYIPRFWGAFLMPFMGLIFFLIFLVIPRIDPKKENIEKFRNYFDIFITLLFLFLLYLYLLTIFWSFGFSFNMTQFLIPAFVILFYSAGVLVSKAEMNWTIGIRTPWTLSSENVWQKTHKLGSKLFKGSALISILGIIFPAYGFWFVIIPVILAVIVVFVFSYLEYRKEKVVNKD